jgi:hypothetical protein
MTDQRPSLRRVGVLWKPKPGSRSKGSGSVTIGQLKQRFIIVTNDRKTSATAPDYWLMSSDAPETDDYAREQPARQPAGPSEENGW